MTAAIQHRTSGPAHRGQSRFFASRVWRRAPRSRNARPEKRVAGSKTASRIFFAEAPKTHGENSTQTLGLHQENLVCGYDFASGCAVAPNNPAVSGALVGAGVGTESALRLFSITDGDGQAIFLQRTGSPTGRTLHFDFPHGNLGPHINADIGPLSKLGTPPGHISIPRGALFLGNANFIRYGGRALGAAGIALDGYNIATAPPDQKGAAIGNAVGGLGGAAAGAAFGSIFPGPGTIIGGVVGGILGGLGGSAIGNGVQNGPSQNLPNSSGPDFFIP